LKQEKKNRARCARESRKNPGTILPIFTRTRARTHRRAPARARRPPRSARGGAAAEGGRPLSSRGALGPAKVARPAEEALLLPRRQRRSRIFPAATAAATVKSRRQRESCPQHKDRSRVLRPITRTTTTNTAAAAAAAKTITPENRTITQHTLPILSAPAPLDPSRCAL